MYLFFGTHKAGCFFKSHVFVVSNGIERYVAFNLELLWLLVVFFINQCDMKIRAVTFSVESKSSHQSCFIEKRVFKNFAKFTAKHLC